MALSALDDLIGAAEAVKAKQQEKDQQQPGLAERLGKNTLHALGELGGEALARAAMEDETGSLQAARETGRAFKTVADLFR